MPVSLANFPGEIVTQVLLIAARSTPRTAHKLMRVSRWVRELVRPTLSTMVIDSPLVVLDLITDTSSQKVYSDKRMIVAFRGVLVDLHSLLIPYNLRDHKSDIDGRWAADANMPIITFLLLALLSPRLRRVAATSDTFRVFSYYAEIGLFVLDDPARLLIEFHFGKDMKLSYTSRIDRIRPTALHEVYVGGTISEKVGIRLAVGFQGVLMNRLPGMAFDGLTHVRLGKVRRKVWDKFSSERFAEMFPTLTHFAFEDYPLDSDEAFDAKQISTIILSHPKLQMFLFLFRQPGGQITAEKIMRYASADRRVASLALGSSEEEDLLHWEALAQQDRKIWNHAQDLNTRFQPSP